MPLVKEKTSYKMSCVLLWSRFCQVQIVFFVSSLVCAHPARLAPWPWFLPWGCLSAHSLLEGSVFVAFPTGGFSGGPPARSGDAGDDLLSVSACSGRCTWVCIRPLAIRGSLVPDDPSLLRWRCRPPGRMPGRPDQSSTRRNRRSSWIRGISLRLLGQPEVYCGCLAKRSPALQACNRARN